MTLGGEDEKTFELVMAATSGGVGSGDRRLRRHRRDDHHRGGRVRPADPRDHDGARYDHGARNDCRPGHDHHTGEPIKIGVLADQSVTFAPGGCRLATGCSSRRGDQRRRRCQRPPGRDRCGRPERRRQGVAAFERLVEEGVIAVGGVLSRSVGAAAGPVAEQFQVPMFLVKWGTRTDLTPESRYTFRTCPPAAPMVAGRSSSTPRSRT